MMAKASELRDMSDEQIRLTWKEASENLFRLRIKAQTERLDSSSELKTASPLDRPLPDDFEPTCACKQANATTKDLRTNRICELQHAQAS